MILDYFAPGQHLVPIEQFPSEEELIAVLDAYDPQPLQLPTFLYRGQSSRFFRRWPPEDTVDTPQHSYTLDSIVPSDYRYIESLIRDRRKAEADVQLTHGNDAAVLRGIAVYVAVGQVDANQGQRTGVDNWFQKIGGSHPYDYLNSIAQHCGLPTGYSDVTTDKRAALWFATHTWKDCAYIPGGTGIIYRINFQILSQAQEAINTMNGWQGSSACRTIDIRDTPQILTPRPHLQSGMSVVGLESPWLLMELIRRNGIQAYLFDRGSKASPVNALQQQDIAPANDPVHQVLNEMLCNNAHDVEFQVPINLNFQKGILGRQYNISDQTLRDAIFAGWQ